jgi:hypothetical protein
LREKYPEDMTIVLQHQFWDLTVTEQSLEVGLSFSGVPERLFIPLDAVTGFFDPSVQFGLKFEIQDKAAGAAPDEKPGKAAGPVEVPKKPTVPVTRTAPKLPSKQAKPAGESDRASPKPDKGQKPVKAELKDKADDGASAEVVSLDAFRKKN